jgi:hypothetical protein
MKAQPPQPSAPSVNHRPDLDGPWTNTPDPALGTHLAELRELLAQRG